jgi:hypothetical protein
LSRELTIEHLRLPLREYLAAVAGLPKNIVIRLDDTLADEESGHTVPVAGKQCIVLNARHSEERQRFTAWHEIGHIVLEVATEHERGSGDFVRRTQNEVFCDVFAAEMLLPKRLFVPLVEDADLAFASIERLSSEFNASLAATGSRFAELSDRLCAFVLAQDGVIRYASRSRSMKDCGAWIDCSRNVPESSLAHQLVHPLPRASRSDGLIEVDAVHWLNDWKRGGRLIEEACHSPRFNQTLSLLWFKDDRVPEPDHKYADDNEYDELALKPLDGILPWPGTRRRR